MKPRSADNGSHLHDVEEEAWRAETRRRLVQDSIIGSTRGLLGRPLVSLNDPVTETELELLRANRAADAEFFRQLDAWGRETVECDDGLPLPRFATPEHDKEMERRIRQHVIDVHRWAAVFMLRREQPKTTWRDTFKIASNLYWSRSHSISTLRCSYNKVQRLLRAAKVTG
jgi:hypothetical protein